MPLRKAFSVLSALVGAAATMLPIAALASEPLPWEMNFQPPGSPIMREIESFHDALFIVTAAITVFVLALLIYVIWRFNERANPQPSRTSHNTLIEVIWTVVPVIILVTVAIPSYRLLYAEDVLPKADMTVKAVGHQWYWSYEYPDNGGFGFDSVMIADKELKPGQRRLLDVDNAVVVPVNTTVRVITTAMDVLHSWAVPSLGVKTDAVPGRLNELWFKVEREGTYYGQCSELCGVNHGFMPIAVQAVSKEKFDAWAAEAKKKFASSTPAAPGDDTRLAAQAPAE